MAQTNFTPILTYKSDTATSVPSAGNLTNSANGAELAVNTADKRLFTKDSGGNVVEVGTNPSSLTLPNSTANGVFYSNGSKVVTSGSALTFDGSKLTVNSNSTTTAGFFQVNDGTTTQANSFGSVVRNSNDGNGRYSLGAFTLQNASGLSQYAYIGAQSITGASNYTPNMVFGLSTGASSYAEQMRLTSTGLGIGTSSPAVKLHASSSGTTYIRVATTGTSGQEIAYQWIATNSDASSNQWKLGTNFAADNEFTIYDLTNSQTVDRYIRGASGYRAFSTNGSERMRIDSSGNLGLGVTPSAWSWPNGSAGALQLQSGAAMSAYNATTYLSQNWYYNAGEKYIANGFATRYEQTTGKHAWYTAASGTAGNAVSWTQAATITAGGDYLVGTTTDSGSSSNIKKVVGGNFRSFGNSATIPASSTGTVLTLSSSVTGVYIVNANFGPQGNAIYGGMLIVVANNGSFRIVTNGGGSSSALSLSGANVQITNAIGSPLDATASAIFIGN